MVSSKIHVKRTIIQSSPICVFSETEMKNKMEELNETISNLRTTISSLEERITKEESDKLVRFFASTM